MSAPPGSVFKTTCDNENNALAGEPDWDMFAPWKCMFRHNQLQRIEFNIVIPSLPSFTSAQLNLYAWDVDEQGDPACPAGPERDAVYFRGQFVGYLTGANNTWSTTPLVIPPALVRQGNNLVQVDIDSTETGCWCTGIDWGQLVLDGGGGEASIYSAGTDRNCYLPGMQVTVLLNLHTTLPSQEVEVEINIVDSSTPPNTLVGASQLQTINGPGQDNQVLVSLDLPVVGATPGYYTVRIFLYDHSSETQNDYTEKTIQISDTCETVTVTPTKTPTRTPTKTPTRTPTRTPTPTQRWVSQPW